MKNLIILAVTMLLIDYVYLNLIKDFFNEQLMLVQKEEMIMKPLGILLTYAFLVYALQYFIIKENKSIQDAFILGLCIYGVYEYTNYTLLNKWKFETTLIDTVWGGCLFALTTMVYRRLI
jgi:uncharacterized membrane protein